MGRFQYFFFGSFGVAAFLVGTNAIAERPDAGFLSRPQERLVLPAQKQEAPSITWPKTTPTTPSTASGWITPWSFQFKGNTVFNDQELSAVLASYVGKPTNLGGLEAAASVISQHYKARGYLLTQAYVPEQVFSAEKGQVTLGIVEARIGRVVVHVQGEAITQAFAQNIVDAHLKPNALINEYVLEKPILLLRDLAGYDASASVSPGAQFGQADVTVMVKDRGEKIDGLLGINNFGADAVGATHTYADLNLNNLSGRGDSLMARAQLSNTAGSNSYWLSYNMPLGSLGTRVGMTTAQTHYVLGEPFSTLGASGKATIFDLAITQPFVRSRSRNVYGFLSLTHKSMNDSLTNPVLENERKISAQRLGLMGNFMDTLAGLSALNTYTLDLTLGRLRLAPALFSVDQATGGLNTAGSFTKLHFNYQREQYFPPVNSVSLMLSGQVASRNLASAEKMSLGGPTGVRAYPVAEGVGDAGLMLNLEYRRRLPIATASALAPIQGLVFYDKGWVKYNQMGSSPVGSSNHLNLGAIGIGVRAGQEKRFMANVYMAWRTTPALPSSGEQDRKPRIWVSIQKWF